MALQEVTLRDLLASGACPALNRAVAAPGQAAGEQLTHAQLLGALRTLPITTYSGSLAASCTALLEAMRAGDSAQHALAAELCGELPMGWGLTSGTTGSSKHFPIMAKSMDRSTTLTIKPLMHMQLAKLLPLCEKEAAPALAAPAPAPAAAATGSSGGSNLPTRHRCLSLSVAGPCEELPGGQLVGSIMSVLFNRSSRQGLVLELDEAGRDMACCPPHLMWQMSSARPVVAAPPKFYALWLCAAAEPGFAGITILRDLFAGNLLTAVSVLQSSWVDLVGDLEAGKMQSKHAAELPPAAVESINARLAAAGPEATAASARHISAFMAEQAEAAAAAGTAPPPLLSRLMPHLQAVFVVVTGTHGKFWPTLRKLLAPHVAVITPWYAGTEGLYGMTEQLLQPGPFDVSVSPVQQRYVMLPNGNCFYEFLEVDSLAAARADVDVIVGGSDGSSPSGDRPPPAPVTMDEVEAGRSYELIITTFGGLARYLVGDVVRVERLVWYDPTISQLVPSGPGQPTDPSSLLRLPLISFEGRAGLALDLVGEKVDEGQLLKALRDTDHALQQQQQQQTGQDGSSNSSTSAGELCSSATATAGQCGFPGLAEFTVYESHEDEADKHYVFLWELHTPPTHVPPGVHGSQPDKASSRSSSNGGDGGAREQHGAAAGHPSTAPAPPAATCTYSAQDVVAWADVLNAKLSAHNAHFARFVASGHIQPARIRLVQPGAFRALQEAQVAARGISPSQFKMSTVVAADSWAASFLRERLLQLP